MLSAFWSVKGGSGTTTVVVAAAAAVRHSVTSGLLLVDLAGDLPAGTGVAEPDLGLTDWLAADADADGLGRVEVAVARGVALLPLGAGSGWTQERAALLVGLLGADHRPVLVDVGRVDVGLAAAAPSDGSAGCGLAELRSAVLDAAARSVLVTRACYLALRRAARTERRADGVVLLREPGRALDRTDVESLLGTDVVAEVDADPGVARAIDAGLLFTRPPRHLVRGLRGVVS